MKKILIMMALIVGFGVSAQKSTKIKNIKVKAVGENVEIKFNTQRAKFVDYQKGFWNTNTWKGIETPKNGPYSITVGKSKSTKYRIRARGQYGNAGDGISSHQIKEIRISEIINEINEVLISGDNFKGFSFSVYGKPSSYSPNTKIRIGNINHVFKIKEINTVSKGTRILVEVPEGISKQDLYNSTFIWSKRNY